MKIAHTLLYGPHKSGLYETTREIVVAEIAAGHDSRMVDPRVDIEREDRGARFVARPWMEEADLLVNHGGVGRNPEGLPPIVSMLHGKPEYCFAMEHYQGRMLWRTVAEFVASDRVSAFVTWSQNVAGWSLIVPRDKLISVRPPVDLGFWTPDGEARPYDRQHTNIAITDRWRPTKSSFGLLVGFARYAEDHPESRLHLYAIPQVPGPLMNILSNLKDRGVLGEVRGEMTAEDLRAVYRAADVVLTSDGGTARTIREAMACGCPLVTGLGSGCGQQAVDTDNPGAVAMGIYRALAGGAAGDKERAAMRFYAREDAEDLFDPANTVADLMVVYDRVLKG